jgi:predicted alpha/beta hydrolase family esterase
VVSDRAAVAAPIAAAPAPPMTVLRVSFMAAPLRGISVFLPKIGGQARSHKPPNDEHAVQPDGLIAEGAPLAYMAAMKAKDADIIMVPGLGGSGPMHWQTRWEQRLSTARRVRQPDWDAPVREPWAQAVADMVNAAERPVVLVAHSLGVATAINALGLMTRRPHGAFLVAPPDLDDPTLDPPQILGFGPYPRASLPFPSLVIGSKNDPYCTAEASEALSVAWGSLYINAGDAGHINTEAGFGPWPEGSMAFAQFLSKLPESI